MKMETNQNFETFYCFKLAYEKLWQMLIYAITYFNTPVNRRLNLYYQQFRLYALSLTALQDFDIWRNIVRKLPANLLDEALYDYLDDWHEIRKEGQSSLKQLNQILQTQKNVDLPEWFSEAVQNIDGWLEPPADLDASIAGDAFETLALNIKQINRQVKGKLVVYNDGRAEFYAPTGRVYHGEVQRNTNEYKLLEFLSNHVGDPIAIPDLGEILKPPRHQADDDPKRRVPDTVKAIKNKLQLPSIGTLFITNRGYYGLKYPVEFK